MELIPELGPGQRRTPRPFCKRPVGVALQGPAPRPALTTQRASLGAPPMRSQDTPPPSPLPPLPPGARSAWYLNPGNAELSSPSRIDSSRTQDTVHTPTSSGPVCVESISPCPEESRKFQDTGAPTLSARPGWGQKGGHSLSQPMSFATQEKSDEECWFHLCACPFFLLSSPSSSKTLCSGVLSLAPLWPHGLSRRRTSGRKMRTTL